MQERVYNQSAGRHGGGGESSDLTAVDGGHAATQETVHMENEGKRGGGENGSLAAAGDGADATMHEQCILKWKRRPAGGMQLCKKQCILQVEASAVVVKMDI